MCTIETCQTHQCTCSCNTEIEDAEHYLLTCPLYEDQRNWFRDTMGWDIFELEIEELLHGGNKLSEKDNHHEIVQHFIEITKKVYSRIVCGWWDYNQ